MASIDRGTHMGPVTLRVGDLDRSIEIYRDRPRSQWRWSNGRVQMAVDPLNLREILAEGDRDPRPRAGLPAGTTMGHVHLQGSDTGQAADFYSGLLGFDITAQMPGAVFASASGYHHHLGLNSWSSRAGAPAAALSAGLESHIIEVPTAAERDRLAEQLSAAGYKVSQPAGVLSVRDPWNIVVLIRASPAAPGVQFRLGP